MHIIDRALEAAISGNQDLSESLLRSFEDQNDLRIRFNLGWHDMRRGLLSKGLRGMDAGRFMNCFGLPLIEGKIWKDEPLEGKVLLFRCEGGFGDQIINFRFAKDFEARGALVVVSCAPELKALFSRHGFVCVDNEVVKSIYYDYWIPAMSAAHVLGYEYDTLSGKPYLTAKDVKPLYNKGNKLKVGIRWSGRPEFEHEQHRRFDPQLMIDLCEIEGVNLYALQRDENTIDGLPFSDLREQMKTFDDTASIIADLDLVITSCTSIAHLSAAMGKETWVIIPALPYYTWSVPGDTSSWYDSVRLFRQEKYGEWTAPFEAVTTALKERALCHMVK